MDTGDYGITDFDLGNINWAALGIDPSLFPGFDDDGNAMPDPNGYYAPDPLTPMPIPSGPGYGTPGTGLDLGGLDLSGGGGGSLGGAGSTLAQIVRMLTGGQGVAGLVPLIASLYGGINASNASKDAAERIERAAGTASAESRTMFGNASDMYKPYAAAGADALSRLSAPIAPPPAFNPVSRGLIGQPSNVAALFSTLGSGRSLRQIGGR